ncbi:MAG: hypothetical protein AAGF31_07420, partial [Planctomycetota bacterium]
MSVVAKMQKFNDDMQKGRKTLLNFSKAARHATATVTTFGTAAVAAGAGVAAFMVKQQLNAVDAISKTSDRLGIATEKLVAFHHAAELNGVSSNTFDMALQRMTRRIAEAAQGTGEARGALAELGLSAGALQGMTLDRRFVEVAEAMSKVENQSDKVRLAMKLFDSEGVALVNVLRLGREGLQGAERDANKLGLTFNRAMGAAAEKANDAITRLSSAFTGLFRQFTVRIAPIIEKTINRLTAFLTDNGRIKTFGEVMARGVGEAAAAVIGAIHGMKLALVDAKILLSDFVVQLAESPVARVLGLNPNNDVLERAVNAAFDLRQDRKKLGAQDPAGDFRKAFEKHLQKALEMVSDSPDGPKPPPLQLPDQLLNTFNRISELKP